MYDDGLAAVVVLAAIALVSRQQAVRDARISKARELAAAATVNLDIDPERSTLLALRALSMTHLAGETTLPEVETVLHQAVRGLHVEHRLPHDAFVRDIRYSPDGSLVATASRDNSAKVWRSTTGERVWEIDLPDEIISPIVFSPDSKLLATISDKSMRLWDVATRREWARLEGPYMRSFPPIFSPDGDVIVALSRATT